MGVLIRFRLHSNQVLAEAITQGDLDHSKKNEIDFDIKHSVLFLTRMKPL